MKKLWQMLLVFAMAVSCVCAVACSNKNDNKTCKHDYEETVVAATCTTGGYTEHKCSKCGDTYKDNEVAALNHDMTDWAEKTPATCTAAQVLEKHCKRTGCDYEETKDGDAALNHDMEWTITLNPTCTADGKKDGACKRTGCTYTETDVKIDKLGHHYVESKTDPKAKAATCTEDGLKVEICDNPGCDDDETRKESVIPALGHTDDGTKAVVTAPTCTEQGYTTYHCETCDQDYRDDYVNELGHEMALEQTVKVSCLTDGYKLWICQRDNCEYSEKREIADKLDHVFDTDGNCKSGCGKTINDKLTWINTKYDVTYNESADRLTLIGGDPGKEQIQQFITIPAFLFKTMKEAGKTQFALNLYKWSETTPIFGLNLTEESADWKYTNNVDTSSDVMTITDEMVEKGFKFILLYADLTQRDPAWKATVKTTGLDFDIEFIKPFDINDKSMWVRSEFASTAYSTEKGKWTITDAAPGVNDVQKKVTISADVFKAMSETYGSFKFKFTTKDAGTAPIFGFKEVTEDWTKYKYGNYAYITAEKSITADMLTNGYSFTLLYADANKRDGVEAADVTGFDMDIEFMPKYDLNNKATWIMNGFESCSYVEGDRWNLLGSGSEGSFVIRAEVIAAMIESGKTSLTLTFGRLEANQDTYFIITGYDRANGAWSKTFELTSDMATDGLNLTLSFGSCGWGGTWVAPTGCSVTLTFA
ncbi:ig domain protein group 2 domain protein [Acidiphilium sp. CAG:727]|nr:ig domain protein group 2 domain protein [Acidiphilium sp. CAG:727]